MSIPQPQSEPSLIPITARLPSVAPAGYAAPAHLAMEAEAESLAETAAAVLADPVALLKLCDRIAALMAQDQWNQRDRSGSHNDNGRG